MKRRSVTIAVAAALAFILTGCLRYSSSYYIQSDSTVDGSIYVALADGYQNDSDPYKGTGAGEIGAWFSSSTITDYSGSGWYTYIIEFHDEPLASFSAVPDAAWKIQIIKGAAGRYTIHGYDSDSFEPDTRTKITSEGGFVYLSVAFPGTLVEQTGAASSGNSSGSGWATWDLMSMSGVPYAKGNGGVLFTIDPGLFIDLFPDPVVTAPAVPEPVVTVTVGPAPVVTPTTSPSPSPTASAVATSSGDGDRKAKIPAWVWATGAVLVAALAGLIGYTLANRKPSVSAGPATPEAGAAAGTEGGAK